jgi:hypothetical protein
MPFRKAESSRWDKASFGDAKTTRGMDEQEGSTSVEGLLPAGNLLTTSIVQAIG